MKLFWRAIKQNWPFLLLVFLLAAAAGMLTAVAL